MLFRSFLASRTNAELSQVINQKDPSLKESTLFACVLSYLSLGDIDSASDLHRIYCVNAQETSFLKLTHSLLDSIKAGDIVAFNSEVDVNATLLSATSLAVFFDLIQKCAIIKQACFKATHTNPFESMIKGFLNPPNQVNLQIEEDMDLD